MSVMWETLEREDSPLRSSYISTSSPRFAAYNAAREPTGPAPITTVF